MTENNQSPAPQVVVVQAKGSAMGIIAFVFGLLSIFFLTLLFAPLSFLFALIAFMQKQIGWAIAAVVCAVIGVFTSPTILLMLGFASGLE